MTQKPRLKHKWHMTSSALWCDVKGQHRKRNHFFWWPTTVTFWDGGKFREHTYFWETVELTEVCRKGRTGNFWRVIAVDNQTIA